MKWNLLDTGGLQAVPGCLLKPHISSSLPPDCSLTCRCLGQLILMLPLTVSDTLSMQALSWPATCLYYTSCWSPCTPTITRTSCSPTRPAPHSSTGTQIISWSCLWRLAWWVRLSHLPVHCWASTSRLWSWPDTELVASCHAGNQAGGTLVEDLTRKLWLKVKRMRIFFPVFCHHWPFQGYNL